MEEYRVRPAVLEDYEDLVALWLENGEYHRRLDPQYYQFRRTAGTEFGHYLLKALNDPSWRVLAGATGEDEIVGLAVATLQRRPPVMLEEWYGFIDTLIVRDDHRRQGLGRLLVEDLLQWFRSKNARTVELSMASKNALGEQFWNALGFETMLVRKVLKLT
jgi:GNAT superfamily N-acetyltransferase